MFFLIPTTQVRPSILTSNKDQDYHLKFARYCLGQANNYKRARFIEKTQRNKEFYKGDQWNMEEDAVTFLEDEDGNNNMRLSLTINKIRPMVEQYRGNAIDLNINYKVKSISPQVVNRRETKLAEMKHYSRIANKPGNPFGPAMKEQLPIGDNEASTTAIFENTYVDSLVRDMNNLAKFVSERNTFSDLQLPIAENMALSGLGVMKMFEYGGHQEFKVTPSQNFFFDVSAIKPDLTDSQYMGEVIELTPSEIYEQWPDLSDGDRKAIDNYAQYYSGINGAINNNTGTVGNGRVPVFITYWRDGQYDDYGYVKDPYGYDYFTKINYTPEGQESPTYTDKDLVKSDSDRARKLLGGKLKRRHYYDVLRTASIIPREILGAAKPAQGMSEDQIRDVTLDWGIAPYQDTENIEYSSVKFPYKCYCWGYIDGEILSPIDDTIDPQRFINRLWSVSENQINNAGGVGLTYDGDMVEDHSELQRNWRLSRPIKLNAKGRGIQNAVGQYDGSSKGGTAALFQIMEATSNMIKETTGVNDAIQGQSTGNDQLVGVTESMIQRGSLMQRPFYYAVTNVFHQCFNSICTVGKRIYADNERNITMAVGDDGAEIIKITKEMRLEDFRCFTKMEQPDAILIKAANDELLVFKQLMMLDDERIANLWSRANPDEVAAALRSYAKEKKELQRMSQKAQGEQEQGLMAQAQGEQAQIQQDQHEAIARDDIKTIDAQKVDLTKEAMKQVGKLAPTNPKAQSMILNTAKKLQV